MLMNVAHMKYLETQLKLLCPCLNEQAKIGEYFDNA